MDLQGTCIKSSGLVSREGSMQAVCQARLCLSKATETPTTAVYISGYKLNQCQLPVCLVLTDIGEDFNGAAYRE